MKFTLNKAKYSGGLHLGYIVAMPLISSYSYAGLVGTELKTEEDLHHFTLCLGFKSNVAYKLNQKDCASWIKEDTYKDSIYNVISNAIADCVLERKEFAEDKINGNVVTFANKDYKNYTAENWNAVVLYNLVYYIYKHQYELKRSVEKRTMNMFYKEYIENKKLQNICGKQFEGKIEQAFSDINEYNRNLDVIEHVTWRTTKYGRNCQAKRICENYDIYGVAKIEMINRFAYKNAAKPGQDSINIYIKNGKIDRAIVYADDAMYSCDFDDYMSVTQKSKIADYEYSIDSDEAKKQILDIIGDSNKTIEEKQIILTPTTKNIDNILDVEWYTDESGINHLAWMDVNRSYLSKAYMQPKTSFNIDLEIEGMTKSSTKLQCIKIDKECFKGIDLEQIISIAGERWCQQYNYLRDRGNPNYVCRTNKVNIGNPHEYKLLMPKCCSRLIYSSNSITSIDLSKADFSETEDYHYMIAYNSNIKYISQGNKLDINNRKASWITDVIFANKGLDEISMSIESDHKCPIRRIISFNKLSKISLDISNTRIDRIDRIRELIDDKYITLKTIKIKLPWEKETILALWQKEHMSEYRLGRKLEWVPNDARIRIYAVDQDLTKNVPVIDEENRNTK